MLYEHYLDLIDDVSQLVKELEGDTSDATNEKITTLLQRLDLMHREGLVRLVEALRVNGAGAVVDRAIEEDPIVRIVLGVYGLADLELPPEEDAEASAPTPMDKGFFPIERLTVRRAAASSAPSAAAPNDNGDP